MKNYDFFNLNDINGINGFKVVGVSEGDKFGALVVDLGDINGDGVNDTLITAPGAFNGTGQAYVLYGRNFWFDAVININELSPDQGFVINTSRKGGGFGLSASGGHDFNGDGVNDFVVAEPYYYNTSQGSGGAYAIFGQKENFSPAFNVSSLNGSNGFYIKGVNVADRTGVNTFLVNSINGDKYAEIIIGAIGSNDYKGSFRIVPGNNVMPAVFDLANQTTTKILGAPTDIEIGWGAAVIDINKDGHLDIVISNSYDSGPKNQSHVNSGYNIGEAYTYYGPNFPEIIDLGSINGTNGCRIVGEGQDDMTGLPINIVGSIGNNNDSVLAVSSIYGDNGSGRVDFIYSSVNKKPAFFNVSTINEGLGREGFSVVGFANSEMTGGNSIGDYNQDGYPDLAFIENIASGKGGQAFIVYSHPGMPRYTHLNDLEGGKKGFGISGITPSPDGIRMGFPVVGVSPLSDGVVDIAVGDPYANQVFFIYGDHSGINDKCDFEG